MLDDSLFQYAPPNARETRRYCWITVIVLLFAYLLLQNRYWVPGGDSDFYVSIARNLARDGKFEYNGLPVAISPPGWPFVMAMIMKVSPTFLLLKLCTMAMMLGSLVIGYFISLRFLPPKTSSLTIILAGLLIPVYSLTYFLHSEGLYCLLSAGALLIAFRMREKRAHWSEWIVLALCCVGISLVRWSGIIQLLPICAVLLSGPWARKSPRQWMPVLMVITVITISWWTTRNALDLSDEQLKALKAAGGTSTTDNEAPDDGDAPAEAKNVDIVPVASTSVGLLEEYGQRFLRSGKWFSWLLWHETRFLSVSKPLDFFTGVVGWVVIVLLVTLVVVTVQRGQLLWLSLAMYCGGLCLNWPNPNSRYLVPVAPLIVAGVLLALNEIRDMCKTNRKFIPHFASVAFVASLLFCNLLMYCIDVWVMRSSNFYQVFEASQHKGLVDISHYLMTLPKPPADTKIVINERYENLNRVRISKAGLRATALLTDRLIRNLDAGISKPTTPEYRVIRWMRQRRVEYLLVQAPCVPWRVWHFHLPMSLYEKLARNPSTTPSGGWSLKRLKEDGTLETITVPDTQGWPTRVPGM